MPNRAYILKQKFQNSLAVPFEQVLTEEVIQQILDQEQVSYRQTIYNQVKGRKWRFVDVPTKIVKPSQTCPKCLHQEKRIGRTHA